MAPMPHLTARPVHHGVWAQAACTALALLTFTPLIADRAIATSYYLDAINGDDTNLGTADAPWKTLGRTYTWAGHTPSVAQGDTIILRTGSYGQFRETTNDWSDRLVYRDEWITYKADTGHDCAGAGIEIENKDKWHQQGNGRSYLRFERITVQGPILIGFTSYITFHDCDISLVPFDTTGGFGPYYQSNAAVQQPVAGERM